MITLHTFGDSILDCSRYNEHGIHPGQLLVRNDDALFPGFQGRDLQSLLPATLDARAVDGATVQDLPAQVRGLQAEAGSLALLTIGGNDLLRGLVADTGAGGVGLFADRLEHFLEALPIRPVLIGNVYDPTFGNDDRSFSEVPARLARANLRRVNDALAAAAARHGRLVDVHARFLRGDASWFAHTIEPSLRGASEVRAAFWPTVRSAALMPLMPLMARRWRR
jgi:acyl-CoA thioesterase I